VQKSASFLFFYTRTFCSFFFPEFCRRVNPKNRVSQESPDSVPESTVASTTATRLGESYWPMFKIVSACSFQIFPLAMESVNTPPETCSDFRFLSVSGYGINWASDPTQYHNKVNPPTGKAKAPAVFFRRGTAERREGRQCISFFGAFKTASCASRVAG